MPHTIHLDENMGVIVIRYSGTVDFEEIRGAFDELVALPGFRPGLRLIADFQKSITPLSGNDVRELAFYAERTDAAWGDTKWALLAASDVTYGLSRIYVALTDSHQVTTRVFRDAREADDWLGLGVPIDHILALS